MKVFFWARNPGFVAKKSEFCHTTPILVNGPFVSLGVTVHFPPWERFPTFRSGVTAVSVKKSGWRLKKSSPFSMWGHRLPVTALALPARRPFRPALGLDNNFLLLLAQCASSTSFFVLYLLIILVQNYGDTQRDNQYRAQMNDRYSPVEQLSSNDSRWVVCRGIQI